MLSTKIVLMRRKKNELARPTKNFKGRLGINYWKKLQFIKNWAFEVPGYGSKFPYKQQKTSYFLYEAQE